MLWIPNNKNLIQNILESEYDTKVAGHIGQDKTIKLIRRNFWWPKMDCNTSVSQDLTRNKQVIREVYR
jgi:hypothetical protein